MKMDSLLRVGFGCADITPEKYSSLAGFGNDAYRICDNILDRPMVTCIAISDENDQTVLLFTADTLYTHEKQAEMARASITDATGIPGERILIAATHTHAGPSVFAAAKTVQEYYPHYVKQLTKAALEALGDRKEAQVFAGQKTVKNMTFVRHYLMNDGSYAGAGFGSFKSGVKAHADVADEQMQLIRFKREGASDIVLVNWQSHATITSASTRTDMSSDYVGTMRNHLEGLSGCKVAFFQGACGNLVPSSRISEEMIVEHDHILYGRKLAEFAFEGLMDLRPVKTGEIRSLQMIYRAAVDHSDDPLVPAAKTVWENYYKIEDLKERAKLVQENGFNSVHHAMQILNRANAGDAIDMELNVLCAGDISFATAPYEMFCSNGKYIKENTPFEITIVVGYCNGFNSYIPDKNAFGYDCYEVNARRFPVGAAEDIAETHVKLLKELKG